MSKKKNLRLANSIARHLIAGTLNSTVWIFTALIQMGEIAASAFFSPSIYSDFPDVFCEGPAQAPKKKKKIKVKIKEAAIRQNLWRLQKMGFVKKTGNKYNLTKSGWDIARIIMGKRKTLSGKWDEKYRVVIFDIPEEKNKIRDWLRQELYLINYHKLQESVFIGKRPLPPDLIKGIKENKIGSCVNYILADKIYKNII